jgi:hypothetical protein
MTIRSCKNEVFSTNHNKPTMYAGLNYSLWAARDIRQSDVLLLNCCGK